MVGSVKMGGPTLQFQWDQGFYENVIGYVYIYMYIVGSITNTPLFGSKNVVSQKKHDM